MARSVEFVGIQRTRGVLRDMMGRFATQETFMVDRMIPLLEQNEAEIYDSWGGRYDSSYSGRSTGFKYGQPPGATRASLTNSGAQGAIRRAHAHSLEFGTNIFYALFQRKLGGPSGKPRGRTRIGPSLILGLEPQNAAYILAAVDEYLFSGYTDADEEAYAAQGAMTSVGSGAMTGAVRAKMMGVA